ncbi:MAG: DUF1731 domain-containing protein [Kiritimatiellaeota bacterium]|nr:DUF1731 domain-containing protein [Kiritimatiellota bacterium]
MGLIRSTPGNPRGHECRAEESPEIRATAEKHIQNRTGQRRVPRRLQEAGFRFEFGDLDQALRGLLGSG